MATPEIDSGSDEGTRAQRGDASWTRSHGWWTEATGSKPRTSATTAVPLCVPVPPGLPPAGFHACTHPRGGGRGPTRHRPPLSCAQEGLRQLRSLPTLLPPLPGQPPWWLLPDFMGPRISPSDWALYQRPSFQITDRDWPAPSVQGTPQQRAQSQVFGAGLRQSSPCSEALAPRGPLRGCPR